MPGMIYGHTPPFDWTKAEDNMSLQESKEAFKERCVAIHEAVTSALEVQVGGNHYKSLKIQPVEYIHANNIGYFEGNVIKYITRWKDKNGIADLEKAKHYIDLLIQLEQNNENK